MLKSLTYYYEDEDEYYFIHILWNELNNRGFFFLMLINYTIQNH